jgi:hypothetical protein
MGDSSDPKQSILARRARFIAAAVASAGLVACGGQEARPQVCLSQPPQAPPDAGAVEGETTPPPQVCLSPVPPPKDAEAPPQVCLSPDPLTPNGTR